jgi:hypothetical protein
MSFQSPVSKCKITIPGLGTLDGLQYANGVQQFCGIPYACLSKRWTRSVLKTWWAGGHHDGTRLGYELTPDYENILLNRTTAMTARVQLLKVMTRMTSSLFLQRRTSLNLERWMSSQVWS